MGQAEWLRPILPSARFVSQRRPCDGAKLAELTAALGATKPKTARTAAATYRDLCEASKSAPPATP